MQWELTMAANLQWAMAEICKGWQDGGAITTDDGGVVPMEITFMDMKDNH